MTMERLLNIIQKNVPQLFMLVFIIAWSGAKAQYPYNSTYNYCDIFCTIDPYNVSSSFVTQGMTDNVFHFKFGSLDAMSGQYFISTGGKYGFIANPLGLIPPKQCFYVEDYNVIRRNEIGASNNTFRYDQYCPTASVLYMDTASVGVVIPSQCIHEK